MALLMRSLSRLIFCCVFAWFSVSALIAQDVGDAPSPPYPTASANDSDLERFGLLWSDDLGVPPFLPWIGDDDDGLVSVTDLYPGSTTGTVTMGIDCSNIALDEYWSIWLDFNNDGDWDDAGERYDYPANPINNAVLTNYTISNIIVPGTAVGMARMRAILKWNSAILGPNEMGIAYGEIEDYEFAWGGGGGASGSSGHVGGGGKHDTSGTCLVTKDIGPTNNSAPVLAGVLIAFSAMFLLRRHRYGRKERARTIRESC